LNKKISRVVEITIFKLEFPKMMFFFRCFDPRYTSRIGQGNTNATEVFGQGAECLGSSGASLATTGQNRMFVHLSLQTKHGLIDVCDSKIS
jgi:hypothetical protein